MQLQKLVFTPIGAKRQPMDAESFAVLFNPNAYSIAKTLTWTDGKKADRRLNAPPLRFGGGGSRTLTLELFYDVTEPVEINGRLQNIDDVRSQTNKVVALTRIDPKLSRPRGLRIDWGGSAPVGSDFPFHGVIASLTQRFTLFSAQGQPLRAELQLSITEDPDLVKDVRATTRPRTAHKLKRGDRLCDVAAKQNGNPKDWRPIAKANKLDNPRKLDVGKPLVVPASTDAAAKPSDAPPHSVSFRER